MTRERPILFSAPMVRAILAGTKTQTRRAVNPQPIPATTVVGTFHHPDDDDGRGPRFWSGGPDPMNPGHSYIQPDWAIPCPYGQPGDRLWVRETWRHTASSLDEARAITEDITSGTAVDWRATYIDQCIKELGFSRKDAELLDSIERWRPSIYMPRWASRITLEVTGVRVERLQDISEADARAEGISRSECPDWHATTDYRALWESINGPGSWEANPWVWVVEFKRVTS